MPIYTPHGLKVRLDPVYAFSLMSRLEPQVKPFAVLETTEAIENAPAAAATLAALAAAWIGATPQSLFLWSLGASLAVAALIRYGMFVIPGLVSAGRAVARLSGFGIFFAAVLAALWLVAGWKAPLAFIASRIVSGGINAILDLQRALFYRKRVGHPFTASEVNFFAAYRLHASAIGKSTDLNLENEDSERACGEVSLMQFAVEWPQVAGRFSGGS